MSPNSDRIAISAEIVPVHLKHSMLFFDRIGVFDSDKMVKELRDQTSDVSDVAHTLANDLEFLQSRNIAFDATPLFRSSLGFVGTGEACKEALSYILEYGQKIVQTSEAEGHRYTLRVHDTVQQYLARATVYYMRHAQGLEAGIIVTSKLLTKKIPSLHGLQQPSTNVIDVVLDKLPMPSEKTPWEQILDFKADTEAQGYLQGLKVWIGDVARQKLTASEAREKLDWLIFQHKKHLEMHKLAYRWGTLGGTFVAAAEILEDLVKIKWGKAAGAVVSIVDRRLELMKAELDNPAKEISYIVKAQEQFGE